MCQFGSCKLWLTFLTGVQSGEPRVCHIQSDNCGCIVVVVFGLWLKSSCSSHGTTAAHWWRHFATRNPSLCSSQSVLWNHDATWGKLLPMRKKKKSRVQRPHGSTAAESLRVFLAALCSPFVKTVGKFHCYTGWSFAWSVTNSRQLKSQNSGQNTPWHFSSNTTRWFLRSLGSALAWLLHRYWPLGLNMKLRLSVCISIHPDEPQSFSLSEALAKISRSLEWHSDKSGFSFGWLVLLWRLIDINCAHVFIFS